MWNIGKRCPVQTNRPPKRRKHKLKKNKHKRNIFSASKHRKMKTWKWICTKDDLKDWLISSGTQTHNKTKRAYRKNVKRHWRTFPIEKRENEKNSPGIQKKNKKKEGKRLLISNIYFYILIYQNKKSKEKRTWTVKGNTQKGAMRDVTFSVGSSQGRACNHAIVPHSTSRHQTHRLKDAAGIRQNKVSTAKHQTK